MSRNYVKKGFYGIDQQVRRFWSKVDVGPRDQCWEWLAFKVPSGYGKFRWEEHQRPHRIAWMFFHESLIPPGMVAMHTCDNRGCCNPWHIEIGTQAENVRDCVNKGRFRAGVCTKRDRTGRFIAHSP